MPVLLRNILLVIFAVGLLSLLFVVSASVLIFVVFVVAGIFLYRQFLGLFRQTMSKKGDSKNQDTTIIDVEYEIIETRSEDD